MRKRKLYVSELLTRCTNKLLKVNVKNNKQELIYTNILIAIQDLQDTWLWNYQVKGYTIINNHLIIKIDVD